MRFSPIVRLDSRVAHANGRGRVSNFRLEDSRDSQTPQISWIEVEDSPSVDATKGALVLPVFPLNVVEWPDVGSEVILNIIEPGYRRMYDDILLDGSRRFLMPWSPCVPGQRGRVRHAEMPYDIRRLHAVGVILYLEDLREVSEETNDLVKYVVKHKVVGRARMTRLLNPSALFRTNEDGWKVDYLRAEVEPYDPLSDRIDATLTNSLAERLGDLWMNLSSMAASMDLPRPDDSVLQNMVKNCMTWQLAQFWEEWQLTLFLQRERARVDNELSMYIREQQQAGKWPEDMQDNIDARLLPPELLQRYIQTRSTQGLELSDCYWEALLLLQASEGPKQRGQLLIKAASDELKLMKTRAALVELFREQ